MSSLRSPAMAIPYLLIFLSLSTPVSSHLFFPGFHHASDKLALTSNAHIRNNSILKLTNDTMRTLGHAFYTTPIKFKNSSDGPVFSFSTSFIFTIVPQYSELGGHGLAFVISPTKDLIKTALPSQYLGLLNSNDVGNYSNHLFAVEFDTVQDFEFGDINDNHVGVDINSLISHVSEAAGYYADESTKKKYLNLAGGEPIQAWIDYDSISNTINVTLSPNSNKPKRPLLSFHIDLSLIFDEDMYVGFSASTGLLASSHYVLGWSFGTDGAREVRPLQIPSLPSLPGSKAGPHKTVIGSKGGPHKTLIVIVGTIIGGLILSIILFFLLKKLQLFSKKHLGHEDIEDFIRQYGSSAPKRYNYSEVKRMTDSFKNKLGQGGYGAVYKGMLQNGCSVAVKILNTSKGNGEEFINEVASISRTSHVNIVTLLGFCFEGNKRALIYEFMANGSLDKFIHEGTSTTLPLAQLRWQKLYQIAIGIARGLEYLHFGCNTRILHFDIKPQNILLDEEFHPKISDFGLAKLCLQKESIVSMMIARGTIGYIAPEVFNMNFGGVSSKSDVYSYGMLVLEMTGVTKKTNVDDGNSQLYFPDWIYERLELSQDLELYDNLTSEESKILRKMTLIGLWCIQMKPSERPTMSKVIEMFEGSVEVLQIPPKPFFTSPSRVIDGSYSTSTLLIEEK